MKIAVGRSRGASRRAPRRCPPRRGTAPWLISAGRSGRRPRPSPRGSRRAGPGCTGSPRARRSRRSAGARGRAGGGSRWGRRSSSSRRSTACRGGARRSGRRHERDAARPELGAHRLAQVGEHRDHAQSGGGRARPRSSRWPGRRRPCISDRTTPAGDARRPARRPGRSPAPTRSRVVEDELQQRRPPGRGRGPLVAMLRMTASTRRRVSRRHVRPAVDHLRDGRHRHPRQLARSSAIVVRTRPAPGARRARSRHPAQHSRKFRRANSSFDACTRCPYTGTDPDDGDKRA